MRLIRKSIQSIIYLPESSLLGVGGEARVYALPQDSSLVAKVYHKPTAVRARKLAAMIANPPSDPMKPLGHNSIVWPVDLLSSPRSSGEVVGFLMPRVSRMRRVIDFYHPKTRREACPLFNHLYLHRAGRNLAAAVRALHARGYVIGDINESNVLVSDTALVTLVDSDSFQVHDPQTGEIYHCPVGKGEFTPPELQGKVFAETIREPQHDLFGLGVIIFQLLMEGTHPFAGIFTGRGDPPTFEERISSGHFPHTAGHLIPYRPMPVAPSFDILHPELRQLFVRCFREGHRKPQARPDAQTWSDALREAEESLISCSANKQHRYGRHLQSCPWCKRAQLLDGRDPFPSQQVVQRGLHLTPPPRKHLRKYKHVPTTRLPIRQRAMATGRVYSPSLLTSSPINLYTSQPSPLTTKLGGLLRRMSGWSWIFALVALIQLVRLFSINLDPDPTRNKYEVTSARPMHIESKPPGYNKIAFSPNGRLSAAGTDAGIVELWDVNARTSRLLPQTHGGGIISVAFSPDGKRLASAGSDRTIQLWDAQSGDPRQTLRGHTATINAVAFSPDGKTLASGSDDWTVKLWEVRTGMLKRTISDHKNWVVSVAFSPDGTIIASGGIDGSVNLRDSKTGRFLNALGIGGMPAQEKNSDYVTSMSFSPDNQKLACSSYRGKIILWNLKDLRYIELPLTLNTQTLCVAFSPNGQFIASGDIGGLVQLWNANSSTLLWSLQGHSNPVNYVAFSASGDLVISGAVDMTLKAWEEKSGSLKQTLRQ